MKIGILDAFPPDALEINWDKTPVDAYIKFLTQVNPPFSYQGYAITKGDFPESVDQCDAYLITGSPKGVYDKDVWIPRLGSFIQESYRSGKKLVGICFGHQILAHFLGGLAAKSEKGWGLGLNHFHISVRKAWMNEFKPDCALNFVHQDQVIELPPGAELLGGNHFCPNLIFSLNAQVLGVQGHPEFDTELMRGEIDLLEGEIEPHISQAARVSLDQYTADNRLFAQWVVNFLLDE